MAKPKFYFDIPQHIFDPNDPYNYQTNDEWLSLRKDRITASMAGSLFVSGKSSSGLGVDIIDKLERRVMQKYSGWIDDDAMSWQEKEAVKRGIVYEQMAADWYSYKTGRTLVSCGFVERGEYLGCSPDRIVSMVDSTIKRLVQIKIPMPHNFIKEVMAEGKTHVAQCKTELYVCDFDFNDLVIFSPELQTGYIREIPRDQEHDKTLLSKMRVAIHHKHKAESIVEKLLEIN